jgi:O-antigen/teichoic acid export membrane protein
MQKNFLWNAAGNVIYLLCQWLITVLVTILGGFGDAGLLSIAMSLSATFQTVAMFGIRSFQVSDVEEKYNDTCYTTLRALTCLSAMLMCAVATLAAGYGRAQSLAILLFMIFRLAESYSDVLHGIAQRNDRLDIAGKAFTVKGIGSLACFLLGYRLSGNLNVGILCMMLFSLVSTLCYDLPAVWHVRRFPLFGKITGCGRLALETLPLCVYLFLYTALSTLPKLLLEQASGEVILGAYSSIFAPAMLLQIATGYIYNPFATQFAQYRRDGDTRKYNSLLIKILVSILAIAAVILIAAQFLGEFALKLIYGEQIAEYVYMLNPILILNFIISYFGFFAMLTVVLRRFRFLILAVSAGFVISLALATPMIGAFGPNGASYSLLVALIAAIAILCIGIFSPSKEDKKEVTIHES